MSNFFNSFKTDKPSFQLLGEGSHIVKITSIEILDSFTKHDGTPKDELPEWQNATPQLAVTVVSAEDGKSGGMTHRFNGCGFRKYEDLSTKEIKSDKYVDVKGYACYTDDDDDLVREECEENTKACTNILNQFAAAIGIEEGSDLLGSMKKSIKNEDTVRINVVKEAHDGKDQTRITKWSVASVAAVQEFED